MVLILKRETEKDKSLTSEESVPKEKGKQCCSRISVRLELFFRKKFSLLWESNPVL